MGRAQDLLPPWAWPNRATPTELKPLPTAPPRPRPQVAQHCGRIGSPGCDIQFPELADPDAVHKTAVSILSRHGGADVLLLAPEAPGCEGTGGAGGGADEALKGAHRQPRCPPALVHGFCRGVLRCATAGGPTGKDARGPGMVRAGS